MNRYVYVFFFFALVGIAGMVFEEINKMKETQFPVCIQDEPTADGAVCLNMIFRYYGKEYTLDHLKEMTKTDPDKGVSMLSLSDTA